MLLDHRAAVVSAGTHKQLQANDHGDVHALREHSGPQAGCRVTSFRCVAPSFIFSFAVENFRDVRRADNYCCKKQFAAMIERISRTKSPKVKRVGDAESG
jgi:hypothetical protein